MIQPLALLWFFILIPSPPRLVSFMKQVLVLRPISSLGGVEKKSISVLESGVELDHKPAFVFWTDASIMELQRPRSTWRCFYFRVPPAKGTIFFSLIKCATCHVAFCLSCLLFQYAADRNSRCISDRALRSAWMVSLNNGLPNNVFCYCCLLWEEQTWVWFKQHSELRDKQREETELIQINSHKRHFGQDHKIIHYNSWHVLMLFPDGVCCCCWKPF